MVLVTRKLLYVSSPNPRSAAEVQCRTLIGQHRKGWNAGCLLWIQVINQDTLLRQDRCSRLKQFKKPLDLRVLASDLILILHLSLLPLGGTQL